MSLRFGSRNQAARRDAVVRGLMAYAKSVRVHMIVKPHAPYGFVDGLELTGLYADVPGRGDGTKVMKRLCEALDLFGWNGYVHPAGRRNYEFYRRFGFDWNPHGGSTEMIRFPAEEGA